VGRLGILGLDLDRQIAQMIPVVRVRSGVVVVATVADAIDSRDGGLAVGDVIYAVNRMAVASLSELRSILGLLTAGDPVVLQLERRGELVLLGFVAE
jgi:S1-C subfamily serine protease